jgi:hypothetical protein
MTTVRGVTRDLSSLEAANQGPVLCDVANSKSEVRELRTERRSNHCASLQVDIRRSIYQLCQYAKILLLEISKNSKSSLKALSSEMDPAKIRLL